MANNKFSLLFLEKGNKNLSYDQITKKIETETNFQLSPEYYPDFHIKKYCDGTIEIHNKKIEYITFIYSIKSNSINSNRIDHQLIIFNGDKVGFIIEKGDARNAVSFLRSLLNIKEKKIINYDLDQSFKNGEIFFWIINKICSGDADFKFDSNDYKNKNELYFNSINGIKGQVIVSLNRVSTQGSDVINTLTALAFLLESNSLTDLNLVLSYNEHTQLEIEFHVNQSNISIYVNESAYCGTYKKEDNIKLRSKLLLLSYLDLIPSLLDLYKNDIDNENNNSEKKKLIKNISDNITKKIELLKKENGVVE